MTVINMSKELLDNSPISIWIIGMMTEVDSKYRGENKAAPSIVEVFKYTSDGTLDIRMTINGVDVDPVWYFHRIREHMGEHIAQEARKLVDTKLSGVTEALYDLEQRVKGAAAQILGPLNNDE